MRTFIVSVILATLACSCFAGDCYQFPDFQGRAGHSTYGNFGNQYKISSLTNKSVTYIVEKDYIVRTQESDDYAGESVAVIANPAKLSAGGFCEEDFNGKRVVYSDRGQDNSEDFYWGIVGDWLFFNDGLIVAPRGVAAYDLKTGKQIWSGSWDHTFFDFGGGKFIYWAAEDDSQKEEKCDCYVDEWKKHFVGGKVRLTMVQLPQGTTTFLGVTRCAFRD